jgi:hypothetical protein
MSTQIRISAKNLGELALPSFCPRCFWLKLKLNNRLPFQIFPGIFSSIDAYTKGIIHSYFDRFGKFPIWLDGLGLLNGYHQPPHYSSFNIVDPESNILLTGTPDGIFQRQDSSFVIVDYKTAKYTGTQDGLLPMYEVQLNAYASIAEQKRYSPVSGLALIYMEPITSLEAIMNADNHRDIGFVMEFAANIHEINLNKSLVSALLAQTRDFYELPEAPSACGCKDCQALEALVKAVIG